MNNNLTSIRNCMYNFFVTFYSLCHMFIDRKYAETNDIDRRIEQLDILKKLIKDNIRDGYITEEIFLDICNKRNLWYLTDLYNL